MARILVALVLIVGSSEAAPPPDLGRMEKESTASALAWLARSQNDDGRWSSSAAPGHPLEALYPRDAAAACDVMATSCALLAFLGGGHTPWTGEYRETAARAHAWIVSQLDDEGRLVRRGDEGSRSSLAERESAASHASLARLNQLWGTLVLLEAAAVSPTDHVARIAAARALAFVTRDGSGARSLPMDEIVLLGALRHVAAHTPVAHDADFFTGVKEALLKVKASRTEVTWPSRYSEEGEYWFRGAVATPQAMMSHVYLRIDGARVAMRAGAAELLSHPPVWNTDYEVGIPAGHVANRVVSAAALPAALRRVTDVPDGIANEASWYWQGMAFRSLAGNEAVRWRSSIVPLLHARQRRGGVESGSWDPAGPHGRAFGREIGTAWLAITMQSDCRLECAKSKWWMANKDGREASQEEMLGDRVDERGSEGSSGH